MDLKLAFIGYDRKQTHHFFKELYCENKQQVARVDFGNGLLVFYDGTVIRRIDSIESCCGRRFDQIIIADDWRKMIYATRADELTALELCSMCSPVPEDFRRIFYNTDWGT